MNRSSVFATFARLLQGEGEPAPTVTRAHVRSVRKGVLRLDDGRAVAAPRGSDKWEAGVEVLIVKDRGRTMAVRV
jgi:hypothetical protein